MDVLKLFTISVLLLLSSGCVMTSSSDVQVNKLVTSEKGSKIVTFLNNTEYVADMTIALTENGFNVKPMTSQQEIQEIREQENGQSVSTYNEASARWGISIMTRDSGYKCAFTDYNIHHFTLMLTDIATNQVALVLKQHGSDGPCTTVEPVFPTLAKSLAENW